MKTLGFVASVCLTSALLVAPGANAATLTFVSGPVFGGPLAQARLDGGPLFDVLCIDSANPITGSWPVEVLTIEQAAGSGNSRGFSLPTLQLISIAAAGMFETGIYDFAQQRVVWEIGDNNLTPAEAAMLGVDIGLLKTFDFSRVSIYNPVGTGAGQQLLMGMNDPSDPNPIPEPATYAMLGMGLAGLAVLRSRR